MPEFPQRSNHWIVEFQGRNVERLEKLSYLIETVCKHFARHVQLCLLHVVFTL